MGYSARIARGDDSQLGCRSELGASKDGSANVKEAMISVACGKIAGESNGDRCHVHVHEPLRCAVEQRIDDRVYGGVIGEHREHGIAAERLACGGDRCCA